MNDIDVEKMNHIQLFVRDAMPSNWLEYADELKNSAEILWENNFNSFRLQIVQDSKKIITNDKISSISRPYLLLIGLSIENIIKGILVAEFPEHINKGKLSKELKSHALLHLMDKIKSIQITKSEKEILKLLEEVVPYWGRYPIPLEYNKLLPEVGVDVNLRIKLLKFHKKLGSDQYVPVATLMERQTG